MKAVFINEFGDVDKLNYSEVPDPIIKKNSITVNIKASSINHLDLWVRKGIASDKSKLPIILGADGSGTITSINSKNSIYKIGDDVIIQPGIFCGNCVYCKNSKENYCIEYGILGETHNGTQAELINVSTDNIYKKPYHLTFEEAASMPLVFMTAYQMIVGRARLKKDEIILIYGGSSGVGSAAIQISKDIGAYVIATAGSKEKCDYSLEMGANMVLNHNNSNWINKIKEISQGVDVIFEHIGKNTWEKSVRLLKRGGRIVTCGATSGFNVKINLAHLFIKNQSILGSTMSSIKIFKEVIGKISNKKYKPFIDKIFPINEIAFAHEYIENRKNKGKVVITHNE